MASEEFTMPPVEVGDVVLHKYTAGAGDPVAFLVTKVGARGVSGLAFSPGMRNGQPFDGVRHKEDPALTRDNHSGFWDYTGKQKALLKLLASRQAFAEASAADKGKK